MLENETSEAEAASVFVSGSNEYVAGTVDDANGKRKAALWKNGKKEMLKSDSVVSVASAVFVSGSDVYVAGEEEGDSYTTTAVLWKNGVKQTLAGTCHIYVAARYVNGIGFSVGTC